MASPNARRPRSSCLLAVALVAVLPTATAPGPPAVGAPVQVRAVPDGTARPGPAGAWAWPFGGPDDVLEGFDRPASPWAAGHRGVDLRARPGTGVRSPAAGVVAFVGVVVDRPVVTVDHGGGLVSSFEPAVAGLAVGEAVGRGRHLAAVGSGGHCSGTCLHWGVRRDGEYIDPLSLVMDRRPSILLPVPGGRTP